MNKLNIFILLVLGLFVIPLSSAVTLDIGTNLTNNTMSVYVDTIPLIVTEAVVGDTEINLTNPSWTSSGLTVNHTGTLTFRTNTLTSSFPRFSSDGLESKTFANGIGSLTSSYLFNVDRCDTIGNIIHKSSDGSVKATFQKGSYTCSNKQVRLTLSVANADTLSIVYGCSSMTNVSYKLIMLFAGLGILAFVIFFVYRKGLGNITMGDIVLMFIGIITSVVMWTVAGQNLGGACPVS
jgi:hypothetical protein